jgi:DNA-binding NarL/FixJ family response regulator
MQATTIVNRAVPGMDEALRTRLVADLNQNLAGLTDLPSAYKQAHWNVVGINFSLPHQLFDEFAERAVGLGGVPHGTVQAAAEGSALSPFPLKERDEARLLEEPLGRIDTMAAKLREAIDESAEEAVTQDIYINLVRGIERILVVDDHEVVRDGISVMMGRQPDFAVVGEAQNGLEAVEKAQELQPDLILMDLRMPQMDGIAAMRQIREVNPEIKFIVLTTYDSDEYIFGAIEAGAKGYLLKDASREELFQTVRAVHRGESLIEPGVAAKVLDRLAQLSSQANQHSVASLLSERETEVLQLMASGAPNKSIASTLFISESTVKTHIANIFQKLDVNQRTGAVTKAMSLGIIKL